MMNKTWMLPLLGMALVACGGVSSKVKKGEIESTLEHEAVSKNFVEAIGIGGADPSLPSQTQRRALSRDAAIVKAQYELLTMVKKVQIEGGITVEQALSKDSHLEAKLNEELKGAEVVKTEWTNDDGCLVTLRIPKKRLEGLMGVKFQ